MKAIYINLDPYLQSFADWHNRATFDQDGIPDTPPPKFDPLPVAVTIPLGESAAVLLPVEDGLNGANLCKATVSGVAIKYAIANKPSGLGSEIEINYKPGFSVLDADAKYSVVAIPANVSEFSAEATIIDEYENEDTVKIKVLVRRENASGPVDLSAYTAPISLASMDFTGADILGATFEGNEIVANESTGVLSAPQS